MEKNCLSCGSILRGRADKKFCSDACKNDFHNHHPGQHYSYERRLIASALKNHRILNQIIASGIGELEEKDLESHGFNFEGLTGLRLLSKTDFQLFCFDFALLRKGNLFSIRKRDH